MRLPCTPSKRGQAVFVRLITAAYHRRGVGFTLEGPVHRPGSEVEHLASPVALEYAGLVGEGRGHQRHNAEDLWIVWRCEESQWLEVARCRAVGRDWVYLLEGSIRSLLDENAGRRRRRDEAIAAVRSALALHSPVLGRQDYADVLSVVQCELLALSVEGVRPSVLPAA